jgi:hypothetical protein
MSKDEEMIQQAIEVFERLAKAKAEKPKDPFEGRHLSVVVMGQWADGERPEDFMEEYLSRNAEHISECEGCRSNIAFYKDAHQKR